MDEMIPAYRGRKHVVLVADDDLQILALVVIVLQKDGHQVLAAADGLEGLEISRQYSGAIDLVIADVQMPNLNGIDLCVRLRVERPGIKAFVMSGADASADAAERAELPFLPKPFGIRALLARVRSVLADSIQSPIQ